MAMEGTGYCKRNATMRVTTRRGRASRGVTTAHLSLFALVILASIVAPRPVLASERIVNSFDDYSVQGKLNHLVVDKDTGVVFLGAVNRLYQLSQDLEVEMIEATGPENDSLSCFSDRCARYGAPKTLTDNVNKVLVIDYANSQLISCGTLFQGICSIHELNNISNVYHETEEMVVANDATASTVAFIAPGPPSPPGNPVLYVGVTYTGNSPYRFDIPAVASRRLGREGAFLVAQTAVTTGTKMYINSFAREKYHVNYVYGFSSGGFSYFLTTQMRDLFNSSFMSKLVRVCQNDPDYYSYTEIPIECTGRNGTKKHNLVQAAYLGKPGTYLADALRITIDDDVLFAVFSESNEPEDVASSERGKGSTLCVYSLKEIRRKFMENIENCFAGHGKRGLGFITPSYRCIVTSRNVQIEEDFCGLDINTPLGGEIPVVSRAIKEFDEQLTAVAAVTYERAALIYVGTARGHLKELILHKRGDVNDSVEIGVDDADEGFDIAVDEGDAVHPDLHFDRRKKHLYVVTGKKVSKVKVEGCSEYKATDLCNAHEYCDANPTESAATNSPLPEIQCTLISNRAQLRNNITSDCSLDSSLSCGETRDGSDITEIAPLSPRRNDEPYVKALSHGRLLILEIMANPKPQIVWKLKNGEGIMEGSMNSVEDVSVWPTYLKSPRIYTTTLEENTNRIQNNISEYEVIASNKYGLQSYKIRITSDGKPNVLENIKCPPPVHHRNLNLVCFLPSGIHQPCDKPAPHGSKVRYYCKEYYIPSANSNKRRSYCHQGNWSQPILQCEPGCGKVISEAAPLIIHGRAATYGEWPWQSAIYIRKAGNDVATTSWDLLCGGTLVSENIVLTAAHCVWQKSASDVMVALGKYFRAYEERQELTQIRNLTRIEISPFYNDWLGNYGSDIALLVLASPVNLSPVVLPACLDFDQQRVTAQLSPQNFGVVMGWGMTEDDMPSNTPRKLTVPVINHSQCREALPHSFFKYIRPSTFCAGYINGSSACNGDSGAGLLFQRPDRAWVLQGVVSVSPRRRDTGLCDPNYYTIYTKIASNAQWINITLARYTT